jgi:DNA-binding transcriptional regulator YdaS (Cro superfamily)
MFMLTLKDYLSGLPGDDARRAFALRCGTSLGHMRNTFYTEGKSLAPEVAAAVERETQGQVQCEAVLPGVVWTRIPDRSWRWHKKGRPTVDVTKAA